MGNFISERRIPTVPEYYAEFYDSKVDLTVEPSQCCPFHSENTPSFKYRVDKGRWTCFGRCHRSGDVYDMHMLKFHFLTRDEAKEHLNNMCGIVKVAPIKLIKPVYNINEDRLEDELIYRTCVNNANSIDRWIDLDYVMSKFPVDISELSALLIKWGLEVPC